MHRPVEISGILTRMGDVRPVVLLVSAWAACATLVGCAALTDGGPTLRSPVNGSVMVGMPGMTPGAHLSAGAIPVCLDQPGSVTVTRVEPVDPTGGMRVLAFAVRDVPPGTEILGSAVGGLSELGLTSAQQGNRTVSGVCAPDPDSSPEPDPVSPARWVDLVVTVTADQLPAHTESLRIQYRTSGGREDAVISRFGIVMCGGSTTDSCTTP